MAIHRLSQVTIGVPDPVATGAFYTDFGLAETRPGWFATTDGGEQLHLVETPRRRLVEITLGCGDLTDIEQLEPQLGRLGLPIAPSRVGDALIVVEPATQTRVRIEVSPPVSPTPRAQARFNSPGAHERFDARADGILRDQQVRPRKLSHVVLGSPDQAATERFFIEGLGFKVSDSIAGVASFLRCSTEHHNVLVQGAPVPFLHHTSWQVDDVDEIGRGAAAMLATDPGRHVWGLGRHFIGSNFFWYLKDPAGNFAEYSSDIDVIVDDEIWEPGVWSGMRSLMAWGPDVPGAFLAPDDLAELIAAGA
jgi:catechol 2,3-dioxygenase-like lactoylglutathione lyase family enzyme